MNQLIEFVQKSIQNVCFRETQSMFVMKQSS